MNRLRHDLDFVVSVGLLATGLVTAATGLVSDLWDLNDFWYHTVSGYLMGAFAIGHVALNWGRLVAYGRHRALSLAGRKPSIPATRPISPRVHDDVEPTRPESWLGRAVLSRRGLFGMAIGGFGGWLVGRGLRPPPIIEAGSDVGVVYHQWSKPGILDALGTVGHWGQPVELYKVHRGAARVPLPKVSDEALASGPPAGTVIAARRSTRTYAPTSMTLEELSRLLFLTSGITSTLHGNARRAAPSSGALYPIEVYPVVHRVDGVEPGVYHYDVRNHALELLRPGDFRSQVVEQGIAQEFLGACGVVLFLTNILQRMRPKYQDRSYRYGLLEAGHVGENAYLAAAS
ncbi:MAG TPA: SagB family peptide dehydrogenase, partial [Candidatus Limnocylindrales bacterium]|nr:SagB family peptide dehydrogenase [Candidatus Limnocylindrales bacterium]